MRDPIYYQDVASLAKLIRDREISPVEVIKIHLDRIHSLNPSINAIVTLSADAIKQAKLAEKWCSTAKN